MLADRVRKQLEDAEDKERDGQREAERAMRKEFAEVLTELKTEIFRTGSLEGVLPAAIADLSVVRVQRPGLSTLIDNFLADVAPFVGCVEAASEWDKVVEDQRLRMSAPPSRTRRPNTSNTRPARCNIPMITGARQDKGICAYIYKRCSDSYVVRLPMVLVTSWLQKALWTPLLEGRIITVTVTDRIEIKVEKGSATWFIAALIGYTLVSWKYVTPAIRGLSLLRALGSLERDAAEVGATLNMSQSKRAVERELWQHFKGSVMVLARGSLFPITQVGLKYLWINGASQLCGEACGTWQQVLTRSMPIWRPLTADLASWIDGCQLPTEKLCTLPDISWTDKATMMTLNAAVKCKDLAKGLAEMLHDEESGWTEVGLEVRSAAINALVGTVVASIAAGVIGAFGFRA
jgi:hypothetical protein